LGEVGSRTAASFQIEIYETDFFRRGDTKRFTTFTHQSKSATEIG